MVLLNKYIFQSCFDFIYRPMFSPQVSYERFFLTEVMRHQIIQHNKFCLNKYFSIENQVKEERDDEKRFFI